MFSPKLSTISTTRLCKLTTSHIKLGCLFALWIGASACTAFETNLQDTEVAYLETARQNYESGEKALAEQHFNEAVRFFEYVKNKFPYSKYATLADLRVADAHFGRKKWAEAADAYQLFAKFHPRHEMVPYAVYRVAVSHFNNMETDVPWLPPSKEKDQAATQDAIRAFNEYLRLYPSGEYAVEANKLRTEARAKLAEQDWYVAEFYRERGKWRGAIGRYEGIARDFPDVTMASGALYQAGVLYEEKLLDVNAAKTAYQAVLKKYPQAPEATLAQERYNALPATPAPLAPPTTTPEPQDTP